MLRSAILSLAQNIDQLVCLQPCEIAGRLHAVQRRRVAGAVRRMADKARRQLLRLLRAEEIPLKGDRRDEAVLDLSLIHICKCVMPTEGIFAVVVKEGRVQAGDEIEVLK